MQPQGPYYQSPQQPTDPFAFLNEQPKKRSPIPNLINGRSRNQRIIVVAIGAIVLIILVAIFNWILGLNSNFNMGQLNQVMGQEQEIINLASIAISNSTNQSYLNFSYTAIASASTDQSNIIKLLADNGIKANPKNFVLQPSADAQLNQAIQSSNFDSSFTPVMMQQLRLYESIVNNEYKASNLPIIKSYMATDFKNTELLISMLGNPNG